MNELCYANNPDSLFRKYAKLVTWFSNTSIGRDYLGVPKDIALMLPNGYIQKRDDIYRGKFLMLPNYSPKLTPVLQKIDLIGNYIRSFDEAKRLLTWDLGLTRDRPTISSMVMMDTLEQTPDDDPETNSMDGQMSRNVGGNTWAGISKGAGTGSGAGDAESRLLAVQKDGTGWDFHQWYMCLFDTSALTGDATISATTITLTGTGLSSTGPTITAGSIVVSNPASNTAIQNSDHDKAVYTKQATDIARASFNSSGDNVWTFNATGRGNVSKTSISKFGCIPSNTVDESEPSGGSAGQNDIWSINHADGSGTDEPTITVTFTVPAADERRYYSPGIWR